MASENYLCKYKIGSLIFMLEEENLIMDASNILSIVKIDNYDGNIRSILKVTLRIDMNKKLWLLKNKGDIVCKFELNSVGTDNDLVVNSVPKIMWNVEYKIHFNDEEELYDAQTFEDRQTADNGGDYNKNDDIQAENYYETQNTLDVFLFNKDLLNASKKMVNEVFTKDIISQCTARILTETEHKEVLMSPIENDKVYKELLIPPMEAYKALVYLDQYYGMYKTGAMIYYDVDCLYILNSNGEMTAKREEEIPQTMFIVNPASLMNPGDGVEKFDDEDTVYINVNEMNVKVGKYTLMNNVNLGSKVKVVTKDSVKMEELESDQSYADQRNEYIAYIKKTDNRYKIHLILARMEEGEYVLTIRANNLDISALTPNKVYQVTYTDPFKQKYYGKFKYRLSFAIHHIGISNDEYLESQHVLVLKKVYTEGEIENKSDNNS